MKPSRSEDITSVAAIAVGATITIALTAALLQRPEELPTRWIIPAGYRAVTVPIDNADVRWARQGGRVDVMVTINDADRKPVTHVVLQDVPVLNHDRPIRRDESGRRVKVNFATLLVTPAEADRLAVAETTGTLGFALPATLSTPSSRPGIRESGLLRRMSRPPTDARP
jgi:Flp pilus assembly protein CpaB